MKYLLNKMLIAQDKANHIVWTILILTCVLGCIIVVDRAFLLDLHFFFVMTSAFTITALLGLIKEIRDYSTGKGEFSLLDVLANLCGLVMALVLMFLTTVVNK